MHERGRERGGWREGGWLVAGRRRSVSRGLDGDELPRWHLQPSDAQPATSFPVPHCAPLPSPPVLYLTTETPLRLTFPFPFLHSQNFHGLTPPFTSSPPRPLLTPWNLDTCLSPHSTDKAHAEVNHEFLVFRFILLLSLRQLTDLSFHRPNLLKTLSLPLPLCQNSPETGPDSFKRLFLS